VLTHFIVTLTQFPARITHELSFRGANFGIFCVQHFQAGLRVNFKFGQEYVSEKKGTSILIKLNELAILCVKSGEFMVFPAILPFRARWTNPRPRRMAVAHRPLEDFQAYRPLEELQRPIRGNLHYPTFGVVT
jgi:hypothetical protein